MLVGWLVCWLGVRWGRVGIDLAYYRLVWLSVWLERRRLVGLLT